MIPPYKLKFIYYPRYMQQIRRPMGNIVVGPFGRAPKLEVRGKGQFMIHLNKSQDLFRAEGGVVLSQKNKREGSHPTFVHFRRYYDGRSGQVFFLVPAGSLNEKFWHNLYLDASVCPQSASN
jgi:hypothetical protein